MLFQQVFGEHVSVVNLFSWIVATHPFLYTTLETSLIMDLKTLKGFYRRMDRRYAARREARKFTGAGIFSPSSLDAVYGALETGLALGWVRRSGLFFDAGSGDGRVVALAAGVFGIPAVGLEFDPEIAQRGADCLRELGHLPVPARVAQGDFLQAGGLDPLGVAFPDISIFFNYISNHSSLARRIVEESPAGVHFFLYTKSPEPEPLAGLELRSSMEFDDPTDSMPGWDPARGDYVMKKGRAFVHVYRK